MKKITAILLVLVMLLSLCACGSDGGDSKNDVPAGKIEPVAVVEDCSIEDVQADSFVLNSKVRNISDRDLASISIEYQLLDANGDAIGYQSQYIENFQAGQAVWSHNFQVRGVDIDEVHSIAYISCRFKEVDGEIHNEVALAEKSQFYVADIIGGGEAVALGESVATGMVEITLKDISFADDISGNKGHGYTTAAPAGSDMVFAILEISVKNLAKEQFETHDLLNVKLDYNDGYLYSSSDKTCYLRHESGTMLSFTFSSISSGVKMPVTPLTTENYTLAIPCASVVAEDESSPLKVSFYLPEGNSEKVFNYTVR